jgi:hypothetical protein
LPSPEQGSNAEALAAAIGDRQAGLLRAQERWRALETRPAGTQVAPGGGRELSEALLRRALQCLAGSSEYALARQLMGSRQLITADPLTELSLQALAQAGLASWDPSTGELAATALLEALMGFFDSAVEGAVGDGRL